MERLLLDLLPLLSERGVACTVVSARRSPNNLASELRNALVPTTNLGVASLGDVRWVRRFRSLLEDARPNLIHVHSPLVAPAVRVLGRRLGLPVVTTEHNLWDAQHPGTRTLNRLTTRLNAATVAVSPAVVQSMPRAVARSAQVVIHGVRNRSDTAGGRPDARAALGVRDDTVVVGCVANARPVKNLEMFVRAAARVAAADDRAHFVHIGDGPQLPELKRLAEELGVAKQLWFLGHRSDVRSLLPAFDVFVLTSVSEGLPVAVMEALYAGVPVVATAVGGVVDILEGRAAGQLITSGDVDALSRVLLLLVQDRNERSLRAGDALALGRTLDMAAAADLHVALYRQLAGGP